jgi:hypothetical protein
MSRYRPIDIAFELHVNLRRLASQEISVVAREEFDSQRPPFANIDHYGSLLAGWCTQVQALGVIRQEEASQLLGIPPLDQSGPYGEWVLRTETRFPVVFNYVLSLELMRVLLLEALHSNVD